MAKKSTHVKFNLIWLVPVFVVGFFVGILANFASEIENPKDFKEMRLQQGFRYINPLLECETELGDTKLLKKLRRTVEKYIKQQKAEKKVTQIAVYYRDLNNGPWFGINEKELFSPASLIKVPMMMIHLKLAENDPMVLDKKIKNTIKDLSKSQNYVSRQKLEFEKEYSVRELIERMIKYSG